MRAQYVKPFISKHIHDRGLRFWENSTGAFDEWPHVCYSVTNRKESHRTWNSDFSTPRSAWQFVCTCVRVRPTRKHSARGVDTPAGVFVFLWPWPCIPFGGALSLVVSALRSPETEAFGR